MNRFVDDALSEARGRTSPWDADRSARVLSGALAGRASLVRRRSIVRRGIALASGAVLVAFAFRAVAFSPNSGHEVPGHETAHETAHEPTQELAQGRTQDRSQEPLRAQQPSEEAQLASRALNDAGYGTD